MRQYVVIVAFFVISGCAPGCNPGCDSGCNPGCDPGCGPTPEGVRSSHIRHRGENFVHTHAARDIYPLIVELFSAEGFELPAGPPLLNVDIATAWKQAPHSKSRRLVRFIPTKGGELVHLSRVTEHESGDVYRDREPDLEWELILRSEPDRALAITREADKRGDELHRRQNKR